jgi:nicotinamide-nucleotide amidase|tara:strand:- start:12833 stop:13774 length:942 start_codon:yes stop_codon:yes gene_type:complete
MINEILAVTPGKIELTEWFETKLKKLIQSEKYSNHQKLERTLSVIVRQLAEYKADNFIEDVVIGMSGGIDSALTAALFKEAGWTVHGVTLPIHQKQEETDRGQEAIDALELVPHSFDLSEQFDNMSEFLGLTDAKTYKELQRQGNIRARLRMTTLYNLAHQVGGCVGSTDNFSELAAGFWTLHGDVGDVAPIQSLSKSWEVPMLAKMLGIPQATLDALPTDGLGISNSDADQLGMTYLEFDIILFELLSLPRIDNNTINLYINNITEEQTAKKVRLLVDRVLNTAFKRANPFNLEHPINKDRFELLNILDRSL